MVGQKMFLLQSICSCANALYPVQAIQWDNCNLKHFSKSFWFEDFSWNATNRFGGPHV